VLKFRLISATEVVVDLNFAKTQENKSCVQKGEQIMCSNSFDSCGIPITGIQKPSPPGQPAFGPGGRNYPHASVTHNGPYAEKTHLEYWIYEPADPTPASAPLIVFLHGGGALNPISYGAWMEHLVRKGNIVIWPRYQLRIVESFHESTNYAINAVKDAILRLQSGGHVTPKLDNFALVGHSLGGAMSANMAVLAESVGLPQPKALMPVMPGVAARHQSDPKKQLPLEDFSKIPKNVLMLVVVGAEDHEMSEAIALGDDTFIKIFDGSTQVHLPNKNFITLMSDYRCEPPLVADHYSPLGQNPDYDNGMPKDRYGKVDTLDYYGFWKLFDALTDAAFYDGKNRDYALGNTPEERFMGVYDDGTLVSELIVTDYAWFHFGPFMTIL
jgi:hypothetical protein